MVRFSPTTLMKSKESAVNNVQTAWQGDVIMEAGQPAPYYCIFVDGEFGVYGQSGETETCQQTLKSGQTFGEFSLLKDEPLTTSLVAHTRGTVMLLSAEDWNSIMRGGLSAVLEAKMTFLQGLAQFRDLGEAYLRANVLPALQVPTQTHPFLR
jgi:CRP-like cAMP-binding protein